MPTISSLPSAIDALRAYRELSVDVRLPGKVGMLPANGGTRIEDMPPERKAEYDAHRAKVAEDITRFSEMDRQHAADRRGYENHDLIAPNVSSLTREESLQQIEYMSDLIQSGEAEKSKLFTGYGDKATNNYRQYVYWLQQHVKELEGSTQSTLAQV